VTAARSTGSGTLQGSLTAGGCWRPGELHQFVHNVAPTSRSVFASGSLTSTSSTSIAVGPAGAAQLVFITQPANGTVGVPLSTHRRFATLDRLETFPPSAWAAART